MEKFQNSSKLLGKTLWAKIIARTLNLCLNVSFPQVLPRKPIPREGIIEQVFHKFERVIHSLGVIAACPANIHIAISKFDADLRKKKTGTGPKTDASLRTSGNESRNSITSC